MLPMMFLLSFFTFVNLAIASVCMCIHILGNYIKGMLDRQGLIGDYILTCDGSYTLDFLLLDVRVANIF